jgi:hypothetical protein
MIRAGAVLLLVCLLLYAPTLAHFFVSDDFLNLERNRVESLAELGALFSTQNTDFYRPLPRLHFAVLQRLFSDRCLFWNLFGVLLHAVNSALAGALAWSLLGGRDKRAPFLTAVLFAVHFIHVEPVVWASGITSLYAAFFVFIALLFFRRARRSGRLGYHVLATLSFAGALLSKESGTVLVLLLPLTTWLWPPATAGGRGTPRLLTLREALPYGILLILYAALVIPIDRGGAATPYRLLVGTHVIKNALFFLFGSFLPLRYWALQDLWAENVATGGILSFGRSLAAAPALGFPLLLGGAALVFFFWKGGRSVRGGFAWIVTASLPFLLLPGSGERFLYLASFGSCLALGVLGTAIMDRVRGAFGGRSLGWAGALALVFVLTAGNLDRQRDWITAGRWTQGIVTRGGVLAETLGGQALEFRGVPESYRSAWVFRNGFRSMTRLYWQGRSCWLEGERPPGSPAPRLVSVCLDPSGAVEITSSGLSRGS